MSNKKQKAFYYKVKGFLYDGSCGNKHFMLTKAELDLP